MLSVWKHFSKLLSKQQVYVVLLLRLAACIKILYYYFVSSYKTF